MPAPFVFEWRGESRIVVPAWRGELHFERDDTFGVPESVLRVPLRLAGRAGGERIVLRPGGPARALKQAYQEADIPAWRRAHLPLLWSADVLVLAAGLGMHRRWPNDAPHAALARGVARAARSARLISRFPAENGDSIISACELFSQENDAKSAVFLPDLPLWPLRAATLRVISLALHNRWRR
jgi:tRNA(Ile)-lysidine synthetase-like protein